MGRRYPSSSKHHGDLCMCYVCLMYVLFFAASGILKVANLLVAIANRITSTSYDGAVDTNVFYPHPDNESEIHQ